MSAQKDSVCEAPLYERGVAFFQMRRSTDAVVFSLVVHIVAKLWPLKETDVATNGQSHCWRPLGGLFPRGPPKIEQIYERPTPLVFLHSTLLNLARISFFLIRNEACRFVFVVLSFFWTLTIIM